MAVPTITSVTPATVVSTSRAQVSIVGTNFNLWPDIPFPNAGVAVLFRFGSEEFLADRIGVISATEIRCEVVPYMGAHDASAFKADVRVLNLDASGNPVPGEAALLANAVTYIRDDHLPGDTGQRSFTERVLSEYLRLLNVTLRANVGIAAHTDYHPEGTIVHFDVDLPAVVIADVSTEFLAVTPYDPDRDRTEGLEAEYLPTDYVWLRLTLVPLADNVREALALAEAVARFGQRVRRIKVPKGPGATARLQIRHYLDPMPEFMFNADVGTSQSAFAVRLGPVPIESPEVVDRVYSLEEALLHAWASVDLTGTKRETTILKP